MNRYDANHWYTCDQCGAAGPKASPYEAISRCISAGWNLTGEGPDLCPDCATANDDRS